MGSGQSRSGTSVHDSSLMLDDIMDVASFKAYYARWRLQPGNSGRNMLVNAMHPVTGTVQRAWLLELTEEKGAPPKILIRWARYFLKEPQFETTAIVNNVSPAPEPYNPLIKRMQTVGYPVQIFTPTSEVDCFDPNTGNWVRGIIVGAESFYYVFRPLDWEQYVAAMECYKPPELTPLQNEARTHFLNHATPAQRTAFLQEEQRRKKDALLELKLSFVEKDKPPVYVRKNSSRLRRVLLPDPFFVEFRAMLPPINPTFFDIGRIILSGEAAETFRLGFWLRLNLTPHSVSENESGGGTRSADDFKPGVLTMTGRLESSTAPAPARLFENGFFPRDEKQVAFTDEHVLNWRDGVGLLAEHRQLEWEYILYMRNRFRIVRMQRGSGTSMYRALSHQLFGTPDNWQFVRKVAHDHIVRHKRYFEQFVDVDFEYYIRVKEMAMTGTEYSALPDHLDLQAICEVFDAAAEIYTPFHNEVNLERVLPHTTFYTRLNLDKAKDGRLPVIRLSYAGADEYDSIAAHHSPPPLRALGGGILGHRVSTKKIVLRARREATAAVFEKDVPMVEYVCYAGFVNVRPFVPYLLCFLSFFTLTFHILSLYPLTCTLLFIPHHSLP